MTELKKVDTTVGTGPEATPGKHVSVHYTGWLFEATAADQKGAKFDSSLDRGQLFDFPLGAGHVIKGWDEAFLTMRKGEKRTLIIPYWLAYGEKGKPPKIPPKATLIFEVELLDFR